ncbi:MAG: hypothetical protein IPH05_17030 [Flavobacteriales bacterium]|jgi:hypothetical protein|nr:hypothetical protein [Flavobacteriales bacterium]MBK6884601.1 hypothetical protein [Flavobacteriales bacterium]MBK7111686.1 hypothetical protein [Flavobacteriales bacterium]MBK7618552.1 hypothetical protein [Flavobacteriales bacterium]MBK8532666.1 hypothetical protein [Flavobacteriales bacterium]
MKAKPILEPRNVDLTLDGGDLSAADLKAFRALLHERRAEITRAQAKADAQPWILEPVPTLQQLVALQHKQEEAKHRKRDPLPEGIIDIDESGIGGSSTEQESAYTSAYIWSTHQTRKRYQDMGHALSIALEPAPSWSKVKQTNRRKKS